MNKHEMLAAWVLCPHCNLMKDFCASAFMAEVADMLWLLSRLVVYELPRLWVTSGMWR